MLGRPSFLISAAIICFLALWILFYALFVVDDGTIKLDVSTVTTFALLTAIVSLALLIVGIVVRVITRPWKSETFVMR
jgi:hypothetical protein